MNKHEYHNIAGTSFVATCFSYRTGWHRISQYHQKYAWGPGRRGPAPQHCVAPVGRRGRPSQIVHCALRRARRRGLAVVAATFNSAPARQLAGASDMVLTLRTGEVDAVSPRGAVLHRALTGGGRVPDSTRRVRRLIDLLRSAAIRRSEDEALGEEEEHYEDDDSPARGSDDEDDSDDDDDSDDEADSDDDDDSDDEDGEADSDEEDAFE